MQKIDYEEVQQLIVQASELVSLAKDADEANDTLTVSLSAWIDGAVDHLNLASYALLKRKENE